MGCITGYDYQSLYRGKGRIESTHYEEFVFVTASLPTSVRTSRLFDAAGRQSISGGRAFLS